MTGLQSTPRKRNRVNDNFIRAVWRIMRRCDGIRERYGADVYILLRRNGRHYEYNSSVDTAFPTPFKEIVGISLRALRASFEC